QARIDLTEVELVGVEVMQQVYLEVAAISLAAHDVAQLSHYFSCGVRLCGRQHLVPNVVAAPAAPVRSQLRVTDETRHRGADHGPVAGHGTLEAHLHVADPFHDLQVLPDQVAGDLVPVALTAHKERSTSGGAIGDRDDEVVAQSGVLCERQQFVIRAGAPDRVGHARYPRLFGHVSHDDLGAQAL